MAGNGMQDSFDMTIGKLDNLLSVLVGYGRSIKEEVGGRNYFGAANAQTLKHHAEDMILAGQKILKDLGHSPLMPELCVTCKGGGWVYTSDGEVPCPRCDGKKWP